MGTPRAAMWISLRGGFIKTAAILINAAKFKFVPVNLASQDFSPAPGISELRITMGPARPHSNASRDLWIKFQNRPDAPMLSGTLGHIPLYRTGLPDLSEDCRLIRVETQRSPLIGLEE